MSRDLPSASRVAIYKAYVSIAEQLQRSASDEWSTVRDKLLIAQINFNFDDLSADMLAAASEGSSDQ